MRDTPEANAASADCNSKQKAKQPKQKHREVAPMGDELAEGHECNINPLHREKD